MPNAPLKQRTAKGLFWGGFSNGVLQLIYIVYGIYIARILHQDDFGVLCALAIFSGIANTIINSGFSSALINKSDAAHGDYNAVFWFSLFMGLFLYLLLFLCAPLIARFYGRPELTALSRIVFTGLIFGSLSVVPYAVFVKKLMTKQYGIISIISVFISCAAATIIARQGYGYWALAFQQLIQIFVGALLTVIICPWKPTFSFDFSPLKQLFSFSFKILITGIFSIINTNIFAVILAKFYSMTDVGNYSQGQKWSAMGASFISGMFACVTQPVLVEIGDEKARQVNALRKLIRCGAFLSFPLMLGLAFVGREFIQIALGEMWLPAVPFLQLFCLWNAVSFLHTLFTNLIFTRGKSGLYMKINIITGLLQLVLIAAMYPFGIFPMIAGYLALYLLSLFVWHYHVKQLIGLQLRDALKDILPYLGITLLCFGVAWLTTRNIQNLYLLISLKIGISALLYVFVMKTSNSVMFKESVGFLMGNKKRIQ